MSKTSCDRIAPDDFEAMCTAAHRTFRRHHLTGEVQAAARVALDALADVYSAVERAELRSRIDMNERQIEIDRRKLAELTEGNER